MERAGTRDIEGKATRVGASKAGRRASFNNRRDQRHAVDSNGRTIWIIDAHRDGTRFIVRADEKVTAFLELTWPIRLDAKGGTQIVFLEES